MRTGRLSNKPYLVLADSLYWVLNHTVVESSPGALQRVTRVSGQLQSICAQPYSVIIISNHRLATQYIVALWLYPYE